MSVDLRFHRTLDRSTQLVFGRGPSPEEFEGHVVVAVLAPAPTVQASVGAAYAAAVAVLAPGATIAARAEYRSEVERPLVGLARDRIQIAQARLFSLTDRFQQAGVATYSTRSRYQAAALRTAAAGAAFQDAAPAACGLAGVFQAAAPMSADAAASWQDAASSRQALASRFEEARPASAQVGGRWQDTIRCLRAITTSAQEALAQAAAIQQHAGPARPILLHQAGRWQDAWPPRPGRTTIVVPPAPGRYIPPPGNAVDLLFDTLLTRSTHLVFGRLDEPSARTVIIPARRNYIVINNVTLSRLPGNTPVPAYALSLQWDRSSWSVGWSASLPGEMLSAVMPAGPGDPVELLAGINGTPVRLLAETISRDRRFGDARVSVSGRGRIAWLAGPYDAAESRTSSGALTSQQIAGQVLEVNGVPLGWNLDWQIPDWLVPAGVWSHQGSRVDALQRIAQAAGGYILGHRTDETIHVLPDYPSAPWQWSTLTPDYTIPSNVATVEGIAWADEPAYNAVYVSGEQSGVLRRVLRAGTTGDFAAQMVTDALITADAVAASRGAAILAQAGRRADVTIRMPVLSGVGVIEVGKFVAYNDGLTTYRGLVRAVRVEWADPAVWQTLEIETRG